LLPRDVSLDTPKGIHIVAELGEFGNRNGIDLFSSEINKTIFALRPAQQGLFDVAPEYIPSEDSGKDA
ncbi:MAG: hypothetical protein WAL51_12120, partial [Candidatus Acidiferrales bacterium]